MKKLFFLGFIASLLVSMPSTTSTANVYETSNIEEQSKDKRASFPGGKEELVKWLKENLDYPEDAKRYGTVVVDFIVKKNGKLTDFHVHKGVNEILDIAAVEILRGMPKWEPAIKNGKAVDSKVQLPVKFVPKGQKGDLESDEE